MGWLRDLIQWWNPPGGRPEPPNWASRIAGVLVVLGLVLTIVGFATGRNRVHPAQPLTAIGISIALVGVLFGLMSYFVGEGNQY